MVRWVSIMELAKVLVLAGLWLIICSTVLGAQPTPLLFGICFLVGIFLRGESLIQLMQGWRPRIHFDQDVFYSNSFRFYGLVMKGSIDCIQDYQAINALVLAAPVSLALDNANKSMYMVLYSKIRGNLLERREAAFLQFSQIFPHSQILSGRELEGFCQHFASQLKPEDTGLRRIPALMSLASLQHLSTAGSRFRDPIFRGMMVVPYIQALQAEKMELVAENHNLEDSSNNEVWIARQPYLLIEPESSDRLEDHYDRQSLPSIPITPDVMDRISLLLPLKNSGTEEATVFTTVLVQLLEGQRDSSPLASSSVENYQETSDAQDMADASVEIASIDDSHDKPEEITIEEASNLLNLLNAEQNKSTVSHPKPTVNEKYLQDNAFCTELCQLQELSLPKEIVHDLCRGFHQQSLQLLEDPNFRSQLEQAKLAGIDELVVKARELCNDLPITQVLCLLSTFATSNESAFDLRELNDLITVLKLTLPLWKNEDAKVGGSFPEKAPSCSYCHLKGSSPETCAKISAYLDHLVNALVYRLAENPQTLSRAERVELGRRIIEELRSQDIKIVFPCVVRAVISQLNLPPSEEDLWRLASNDSSSIQNPPLAITGRN
ncbi:MAG: hypothetical protein ACE5OZ_11325 [Candidatus Heimdallarchaeota archaeon]